MAFALKFDGDTVEVIEDNNNRKSEECCWRMLNRWINGEGDQPASWEMLVEALRDAELGVLADELEQLLVTDSESADHR